MYKQLREYCLSKKGAVEEYPFGPDPAVMKVGGKMFALLPVPGDSSTVSISLKCDPVIAENLREQHACITAGYHLNKKHWNTVIVNGSLPLDDLRAMIDHSYELVLKGLSKAAREAVLMRLGDSS